MSYGGVESNPSHLQQTQAQVRLNVLFFTFIRNESFLSILGARSGWYNERKC